MGDRHAAPHGDLNDSVVVATPAGQHGPDGAPPGTAFRLTLGAIGFPTDLGGDPFHLAVRLLVEPFHPTFRLGEDCCDPFAGFRLDALDPHTRLGLNGTDPILGFEVSFLGPTCCFVFKPVESKHGVDVCEQAYLEFRVDVGSEHRFGDGFDLGGGFVHGVVANEVAHEFDHLVVAGLLGKFP